MKRTRESHYLTRRESEIMGVLYKLEEATVADVLEELSGKRNYSTVRAQLRVLEEKCQLRHSMRNLKYVYTPIIPRDIARRSAVRHLIEIFFDGCAEKLVVALMAEGSK